MSLLASKYVIRANQSFIRRCLSSIFNAEHSNLKFSEVEDQVAENVSDTNRRKVLTVAIIGRPNAGKSTLVNRLIKRTVCPTSSKVHTTQHNADAIYKEEDTQLIFTDTPGIVIERDLKKYKFKESFVKDPEKSTSCADIVGFVQDVSNSYTRHLIPDNTINLLEKAGKVVPIILILNKVDLLKRKKVLLTVTDQLTNNKKYPKFMDVFMVSALNADGVDDLRQYFLDMAKSGEWKYSEEKCSNQTPDKIIEETVKAKLMDALVNEIAYNLDVRTQYCVFRPDGSIYSIVDIKCRTDRIRKLLLKGKKMKYISAAVEEELRSAFHTSTFILLNVIHEPKTK